MARGTSPPAVAGGDEVPPGKGLAVHRLTVPGKLESLGVIREFVDAAATEAGVERRRAYRLKLAVDEVATNIVTHGYAEHGLEGVLYLESQFDEETLAVVLEDTAPPYDPRTQGRPPNLDTPLGERTPGGLGVYLAVHNVDAFQYARVGKRNRNVFTVYRTVPE
jgi:serine/threonine-protein kinase RsbW